jgi:hypothetical protein
VAQLSAGCCWFAVSLRSFLDSWRLVVTTDDFENALRFYRNSLGTPELPAVAPPGASVAILDAGRATLELADPKTADSIDEVEVGIEWQVRSVSHWR